MLKFSNAAAAAAERRLMTATAGNRFQSMERERKCEAKNGMANLSDYICLASNTRYY